MASQGPKASSSVCMGYAVDSGVAVLYRKNDKERGKIEVPRGVEEIERILHSCHSSKESEYDCSARIYVRIGARLSLSN